METPWLEAIGEDYIAKAFEYAHEADPDAELYYNDYNLWKPAKRDAAIRLVAGLKAKGLRVDGIGEQGHWGLDRPAPRGDRRGAGGDGARPGSSRLMHRARHGRPAPRPRHVGGGPPKEAKIRATTNMYPDGLPAATQEKLARGYADVFTIVPEARRRGASPSGGSPTRRRGSTIS